MKKRLLCLMASLLLCGAVSAQTHFEVDTHAQDNNMPVVAQVVLDGQTVTTGGYELGAFVGNAPEARGSAQIQTGATLAGTYWIQVYYTSFGDDDETGATVTFKLYDGEDEYTAETTLTIDPEGAGTLSDPVEIVVNRAVTQTTAMVNGWNWWSSRIEATPSEALTMLENSLGNNGIMIAYQNANVQNYYPFFGYDYWQGALTGIDIEKGYKINVSQQCNIEMVGRAANPLNHPVTITHNWNWIGYPLSSEQSVSEALGAFVPETNDIITGQSSSATYWAGFGWYPQTMRLIPGSCYLYKSNATENKTLVFQNGSTRSSNPITETQCIWQNDVYAYPDNAIMISTVYLDEEEQRNEDLEVVAFVNGECRGSSMLRYFEPLDKYYALLTIKGQDDDLIEFALVDHNQNMNSINNTRIVFENNMVVGSLDKPYELHFSSDDGLSRMIKLFPNPVDHSQVFSLAIPENERINDIYIIDELGSLVRHTSGAISTSHIEGLNVAGVYMIKVVCASGNTYYGKLIVK